MNKFASLSTAFTFATIACLYASSLDVAAAGPVSPANSTIFGPNVFVFDAGMPAAYIQSTATGIFSKMESNQFGAERYALLFKPGKYNVTFNVGFYTHVAGLGKNPDDVNINGGVNVNAQWMPNANATCNFWRTLENFAVTPSSTKGVTRIAVSQAAPLRRLHVKGSLHLFDFDAKWNAGWASGGFLADSVVDGEVVPASQQQWLSRNSKWARWSNGVWNMVFVGDVNVPQGTFPNPPYTVVKQTPIIREKPYLYVDGEGQYFVFVPALQTNTTRRQLGGRFHAGQGNLHRSILYCPSRQRRTPPRSTPRWPPASISCSHLEFIRWMIRLKSRTRTPSYLVWVFLSLVQTTGLLCNFSGGCVTA